MPWKPIRLRKDKATSEPLVEPVVSKSEVEKESSSQKVDPAGGWKKFLLEGDPVFITSEDLQGDFVLTTGTTSEIDISGLSGAPDLTGTKRRRYGLYFDMTGVYINTAAWTKCITRVKTKVNGVNYRTIDRKDIEKLDLSPSEEPALPVDIPPIAKDITVTMQFDVGLTNSPVPPRIYWAWVKEKFEKD